MFGFVNDYLKKLNLKDENFRIVIVDGCFLCVQGFKDILKIDASEIILKIKDGELMVNGQNLSVKELSRAEILISGNILRIER